MLGKIFGWNRAEDIDSPTLPRRPNLKSPYSQSLFEGVLMEYRGGDVPALSVPVSEFMENSGRAGKSSGPFRIDSVCFRQVQENLSPRESLKQGIEGLIREARRKNGIAVARCELTISWKSEKDGSKKPMPEFYGQVVIPVNNEAPKREFRFQRNIAFF
ncbi:MAG: hypothetical protein JW727_06505 [Candidatus Aenigmarchaeota archaeon]|nr:hypothetical protein [Candidatus Aenigmarchaeota archaeon]